MIGFKEEDGIKIQLITQFSDKNWVKRFIDKIIAACYTE